MGTYICVRRHVQGGIDSSKAAVVMMQLDETLNEKITEVYIQSALLYTTSTGSRRIRVSTMAVPVARSPQAAFLKIDIWSAMVVIGRLGMVITVIILMISCYDVAQEDAASDQGLAITELRHITS